MTVIFEGSLDEVTKRMFPKEEERKSKGQCPFCGEDINPNEFRDELSRREFAISGLCQDCQDDTFGR